MNYYGLVYVSGLSGESVHYYESLEGMVPWGIYAKSASMRRLAEQIVQRYANG